MGVVEGGKAVFIATAKLESLGLKLIGGGIIFYPAIVAIAVKKVKS
jgi:hypothetical protein